MLGYLFSQLLGFVKTEKELEIEKRITALEEAVAKDKPKQWAEGKRV
jgi:hypothetical protein